MTQLHEHPFAKVDKSETPMSLQVFEEAQSQLPQWQWQEVDGNPLIRKSYKFKDFVSALAFANKVGALAEEYNHHPSILVEWGKVQLSWWTHSIGGVHQNDLIMAAKSDKLMS